MIERGGWWTAIGAIGIVVFALFMIEAMMQFTATLVERQPRSRRNAASANDLVQRLLAAPSPDVERDHLVVRRPDGALELQFRAANALRERFAKAKFTTTYRARMLLDPRRREVRWYESIRSSSFFIGLDGWVPQLNAQAWYQGGYVSGRWVGRAYAVEPGFPPRIGEVASFDIDTDTARSRIATIVTRAGWTFRPVMLPVFVTPRWLHFTDRVVPGAATRVPRRALWSVLYPFSYVLLIGYLRLAVGPFQVRGWLLTLGISALWWAVWGGIAAVLRSTGPPQRQKRPGRGPNGENAPHPPAEPRAREKRLRSRGRSR